MSLRSLGAVWAAASFAWGWTSPARANEEWFCRDEYLPGKFSESAYLLAGDRLTPIGGDGNFVVLETDADHIVAYHVFWDKNTPQPRPTYAYILIDRKSGILTEWNDIVAVALGNGFKDAPLTVAHGTCVRQK